MSVTGIAAKLGVAAGALLGLGVLSAGCSTEFINEGPGVPSDRSTGTVPEGVNGVCRQPNTARPIIADQKLWEHARTCTPRTPARFIRLGYTPAGASSEADALKEQEGILAILKDGAKDDGNNKLVSLMRALHERGLKDPALAERVSRQTTHDYICDYSYLLNTMARQREKLAHGEKCTARAYDTVLRETCPRRRHLHEEAVWLTSSWSCVTHTGALGAESSCFRMCAYDDYCAKHVSCGTPDVDLTMCALGVCVPEARALGCSRDAAGPDVPYPVCADQTPSVLCSMRSSTTVVEALVPVEDGELPVGAGALAEVGADAVEVVVGIEVLCGLGDEVEQLVDEVADGDLLLLAEVDELAVEPVAHGAPLVLLDERAGVLAEREVPPVEQVERAHQRLDERGDRHRVVDARRHVADADLHGVEEGVGADVPPDLLRVVDTARPDEEVDVALERRVRAEGATGMPVRGKRLKISLPDALQPAGAAEPERESWWRAPGCAGGSSGPGWRGPSPCRGP